MKAPTHSIPSGDRLIARLFFRALEHTGFDVELASTLRTWDGRGDVERQRRLRALSARCAQRYLVRCASQPPQAWFTYHSYYKAPDWIGPHVSSALSIPYILAEASHAPKRAKGPWALGFTGAKAAISAADAIVNINSNDAECVQQVKSPSARLLTQRPFLDLAEFDARARVPSARQAIASRHGLDLNVPWLVCVAMMRHGDKLASYRILADALNELQEYPWHLLIIGDGEARTQVDGLFASFAQTRVAMLGQCGADVVPSILKACDLFVWPAVNEAFGMALLEAHAAGLAVAAGDSGGVSDIVRDQVTCKLAPSGDAAAFASAIRWCLRRKRSVVELGEAARRLAEREHDIVHIQRVLKRVISEAVAGRIP